MKVNNWVILSNFSFLHVWLLYAKIDSHSCYFPKFQGKIKGKNPCLRLWSVPWMAGNKVRKIRPSVVWDVTFISWVKATCFRLHRHWNIKALWMATNKCSPSHTILLHLQTSHAHGGLGWPSPAQGRPGLPLCWDAQNLPNTVSFHVAASCWTPKFMLTIVSGQPCHVQNFMWDHTNPTDF